MFTRVYVRVWVHRRKQEKSGVFVHIGLHVTEYILSQAITINYLLIITMLSWLNFFIQCLTFFSFSVSIPFPIIKIIISHHDHKHIWRHHCLCVFCFKCADSPRRAKRCLMVVVCVLLLLLFQRFFFFRLFFLFRESLSIFSWQNRSVIQCWHNKMNFGH